jgi:hypothetical protein
MKPSHTLFGSILLAVACSAPAWAGLGGDMASIEADRVSLKGVARVTSGATYSVHEIEVAGGLRVREYLSPRGKVFAVSWRGPGIPDLRQMLGSYYGQFAQAASTPHYNHHHLSIQTPEVVVQSSGHARAFFGRAWAPAMLPQHFSVSQIN